MANPGNELSRRIGEWTGATIVAVLLLLGLWKLGSWLFLRPSPTPLGLSAFFEPTNAMPPGLRIRGESHLSAAADTNTWIKVLVETAAQDFRQTAVVTATNGVFELDGNRMLGLRTLGQEELVRVRAEVWHVTKNKRLFEQDLFINGRKPLVSLNTLGLISCVVALVAVLMFLRAFTGDKTTAKNQLAIQFSYCVIIVWLGVPILVPTVLPQVCPALFEGMSRHATPVGLVITRLDPGDSVGRDSNQPQWVFNIGGSVERLNSLTTAPPGASAVPADHPRATNEVIVHGGLVIPLWVIILSLIGGAINMTTKVPLYQQKMEEEREAQESNKLYQMARAATAALVSMPGELAKKMLPQAPAQAERSAGDPHAKTTEDPGSAESYSSDKPAAGGQAAGAKTSKADEDQQVSLNDHEQWRRGLLGEYMSLISAPFLAIVTYYLLRWGDLARLPVLVIVSFSIGLLSARIIRSITDLAGTFVDQSARGSGGTPRR